MGFNVVVGVVDAVRWVVVVGAERVLVVVEVVVVEVSGGKTITSSNVVVVSPVCCTHPHSSTAINKAWALMYLNLIPVHTNKHSLQPWTTTHFLPSKNKYVIPPGSSVEGEL